MATVKIEGQNLTIPDEIAKDDSMLRSALQVSFPDAKNAEFKRDNKDGNLTVTVNKKPGTKGNQMGKLIADLLNAKEAAENPAGAMYRELKQKKLKLDDLPALLPAIRQARDEGQAEARAQTKALETMQSAPALSFSKVPTGF